MSRAATVQQFSAPALELPRSRAEVESEAARRYAAAEAAGHAAGFAEGFASGERAAADARDEHRCAADRLRAAAAALETAAAALAAADRIALADVEQAVVGLAVELAAELVGQELPDAVARVRDTLRRAAPLVADRGTPVVRVHPSVAAELSERIGALDGVWAGAEVVSDGALAPGECLVDVGACRIDAQLDTAVAALRRIAAERSAG